MGTPHITIQPGQTITIQISVSPGPGSFPPTGRPPAPAPDDPNFLAFPVTAAPSPHPDPEQLVPAQPAEASLTIRQVYETWIQPEREGGAATGTIREDSTSLGRWERVCSELGYPDASVSQIDSRILQLALNYLRAGHEGKIAAATIRKMFSLVRMCLRRAEREGLIKRVPIIPSIREAKRRPGMVTIDEVDALYRHADAALWPRPRGLDVGKAVWQGLTPGHWWRAWFVLFWHYGARTQDFVATQRTDLDGLLWESLIDQPECPDDSMLGLSCPHGWIEWMPEKTKQTRGETLLLPRTEVVNRHLEPFRGLDAEKVFPVGKSKVSFSESLQRIRSAAGVPDAVTISDTGTRRGRKMRSIRKGCSNNWDSLKEGLGAWILGHAGQGTNAAHYRNALPDIVRLIDNLPMPASFSGTVAPECDRPGKEG